VLVIITQASRRDVCESRCVSNKEEIDLRDECTTQKLEEKLSAYPPPQLVQQGSCGDVIG
jgi:hypothetical protein